MRKFLLFISFFSVTPLFLIFTSLFLVFISFKDHSITNVFSFLNKPTRTIAYAALPTNLNVMEGVIGQSDSRVQKVHDFYAQNGSPLTSLAEYTVTEADKYGIDYRLVPAIGAQESANCTKGSSTTWKNCWGYGIYGKHKTTFQSYTEAIDTITRYLANKKSGGVDTLEEIGNIWNPSNHNDWKENVSYFMNQL